ncbi:shikimate kinase, partial [Clostridiaceae bacterium HSG29]|nr:shikimate kinase [Clostridiaceae bacterium HSG29]
MNNIYLIGMMGSGKSTVGKIISEELNYCFFDGDDYIVENSEFNSIEQIFKDKGENYFRKLETEKFKELTVKDNCIIATGG